MQFEAADLIVIFSAFKKRVVIPLGYYIQQLFICLSNEIACSVRAEILATLNDLVPPLSIIVYDIM